MTKILEKLNVTLPQSFPQSRQAVPVSPDGLQSDMQPKQDKKLSDRDVLSIMNAPLIEFEPQTVQRIYEI